jgi:hypothetical protein
VRQSSGAFRVATKIPLLTELGVELRRGFEPTQTDLTQRRQGAKMQRYSRNIPKDYVIQPSVDR